MKSVSMCVWASWNYALPQNLVFLSNKKNQTWKNKIMLLFQDSWGKPSFSESVLLSVKWLVWLILVLTKVFIDCFHQKIFIKLLWDQFWWIVKGQKCFDHQYFVKLTNSYVGRQIIPHLRYFRPVEWYSLIDPKWQRYCKASWSPSASGVFFYSAL